MKNYIKKTRVKAMQWNGLIEEMLLLQELYPEFVFMPLADGSIEIHPPEDGKPKLCSKGEYIVEHKGELHVTSAEAISADYYVERSTGSKEEEEKPKRTRRTKAEIEAEKGGEEEEKTEESEQEMEQTAGLKVGKKEKAF